MGLNLDKPAQNRPPKALIILLRMREYLHEQRAKDQAAL